MALSSLALNDSAAVSHTFLLRSEDAISGATYQEQNSSAAAPILLTIKPDRKPIGVAGSDRITISTQQTALNAATGKPATHRVSMQFTISRDTAVTQAMLDNIYAYAKNYFTDAGRYTLLTKLITP